MSDIARLLDIMAALRTPGSGCPWDLEQNFATIAPYTIEEAYEVADAIARGDIDDLREELGDLLLQVVFHARMAQEQGAFEFGDVVQTLIEKLVRRHPHVFGDARGLTAEAVEGLWERIKTEERAQKQRASLMRIALRMPAPSGLAPKLGKAVGGTPVLAPAFDGCHGA
jgi:ATP diphosphatase